MATTQESPERGPVSSGRGRGTDLVLRARRALAFDSWLFAVVAAFVLTFAVAGVVIALMGASPWEALRVGAQQSLGTVRGVGNTLVFATPRLLVALGAVVAIRSGLFNLGGEGQLQMGAVGAALAGVVIGPMFAPVHVLLAVLLAAAFGAAWGALPAALQVWRGADLLITTLLLNFVGIYFVSYLVQGPFQDPARAFNQSPRIAGTAQLPVMVPGTRLHAGFLIAAAMAVAVAYLMNRTTTGYSFRVVGSNPVASRFAGLPIVRLIVLSMAVSGAIGGLAGATEVLGVHFRLLQGFSNWIGFQGLAIAFLGGLQVLPTVFVAVLYGALENAVFQLQHRVGIPASVGFIVQGLPIVFLAAFRGLALLRRPSREGSR